MAPARQRRGEWVWSPIFASYNPTSGPVAQSVEQRIEKNPGTEKIQQNQRLKSPIKNGVARPVRQPAKSSPPSRNWHSIRLAGNA
jgi:hypothetical protein